jgi:hypothetical protein
MKLFNVTVDDSPAEYDEQSGNVTCKRALGVSTYCIHDRLAFWRNEKTCIIDGKIIVFSSDRKPKSE